MEKPSPNGDEVRIDPRVSLDVIAQLVELRIRERRRVSWRWRWGIFVAVSGIVVAVALSLFEQQLETRTSLLDERLRQTARARVDSDLQDRAALGRFENAQHVTVGRTRVTLAEGGTATFRLEVEDPFLYAIEAIARARFLREPLDPVLFLYRVEGDSLEQLASDDDSGEGRNARIDQQLEPDTTYYLEIEDLFGEPGPIDLFVRMLI